MARVDVRLIAYPVPVRVDAHVDSVALDLSEANDDGRVYLQPDEARALAGVLTLQAAEAERS